MKIDCGSFPVPARLSGTHTHQVINGLDGRNGPWVRWRNNRTARNHAAFKAQTEMKDALRCAVQ